MKLIFTKTEKFTKIQNFHQKYKKNTNINGIFCIIKNFYSKTDTLQWAKNQKNVTKYTIGAEVLKEK